MLDLNDILTKLDNSDTVSDEVLTENLGFILQKALSTENNHNYVTAMDQLGLSPITPTEIMVYGGDFSKISKEFPTAVNKPRITYGWRSIKKGTDAATWIKKFYETNPSYPQLKNPLSRMTAQEKVDKAKEIGMRHEGKGT
ncbi:hypothetical protein K8R33_04335 [archaeon]|nr:hypothetical protein [archaeon]